MKGRLLLLLTALAALLGAAWAVTYQRDELLWSKQQWSEYKLDFPYSIFKTEDKNTVAAKERLLAGEFVDHSLNGPQSDLKALIEEDATRGKFEPSSFAVTTLAADTPVEGAIAVVQCKVCIALVSLMWDHLISWTHVAAREATPADVTALNTALCEIDVTVGVLKDWAIMYAQVNQLIQPNGQVDGPKEFYMLSKRHRQHATEREIQATRMACRAVLGSTSADGGDKNGHSPLSVAAAQAQIKYFNAMKEKLGASAPVAPANAPAPPTPQRLCLDKHPQCQYWADLGECTANPVYMVGNSQGGWCRKACRECTPPPLVTIPSSWSDDDVAALNTTSSHYLDFLHEVSCIKATSCRWTEGTSAKAALAEAAGVDAARTAILNQAAIVAGPVTQAKQPSASAQIEKASTTTTTITTTTTVDSALLQESIIKDIRASDAAIIKISKEKRITRVTRPPLSSRIAALEKRMWTVLGNTCMYLTTGWWSYEVCYYGSATQYHVEDDQAETPDWVISLGHFAAAEWKPSMATDASLFPPGSSVPYTEHALVDGNVCMLTGEEGVGRGHSNTNDGTASAAEEGDVGDVVKRSTSLRFMCSPDSKTHMVVKEPKQCRYIVEVYLWEVCGEEGMGVQLPGGGEIFTGSDSDGDGDGSGEEEGSLDSQEGDQFFDAEDEQGSDQEEEGTGGDEDGYKDDGGDGEYEEEKLDVKDEL